MNGLLIALRSVEERYKDEVYGVGEPRISDMAKDCANAIEKLIADKNHLHEIIAEQGRKIVEYESNPAFKQVKAERDAAVEDTRGYCASCAFVKDCAKHDNNDAAPPIWYYGDCEEWQWRGLEGQA